jgi:hypothetical protein
MLTLLVSGDTDVEPDEDFSVTLSNSNAGVIAIAKADGVIRNDDIDLAISDIDASKFEGDSGDTPFKFRVTRSGDLRGRTTVDFEVLGFGDDPADADDFNSVSVGDAPPLAAAASQSITDEGPASEFTNPKNRLDVTDDGAVTAFDALVVINHLGTSGGELDSSIEEVAMFVDPNGDGRVSASDALVVINALGVAEADVEVPIFIGDVTFEPGEIEKIITVNVSGDLDFEPDEGFKVTLSNPGGNAEIATDIALGEILNDDAEPIVVPEVEEVIYFNQDAQAEKDFSPDSTGQRSIVRRIQITFAEAYNVQLGAVTDDRFVLESLDTATLGARVGLEVLSSELVGGKQIVVLGFTGTELIDDRSENLPGVRPMLQDGNYQLIVERSPGSDFVEDFYRFFGDSDGDRDVDGLDYFAFQTYFLDGILDNRFDCDQDGTPADMDDYDEFLLRAGRVLRRSE